MYNVYNFGPKFKGIGTATHARGGAKKHAPYTSYIRGSQAHIIGGGEKGTVGSKSPNQITYRSNGAAL